MILIIGFACQLMLSQGSAQCPPGSYLSKDGCVPCSWCDLFSIVRRKCTASSDTQCTVCAGIEEAVQRPECRRCPPCPEGQYLFKPCNRRHVSQCKVCPRGSYSPQTSYLDICNPCTSCESQGRKDLLPCTNTKNAVCGHCKKGFYLEHGSSRCVRCRPCKHSLHRIIGKCHKDGMGRNCGRQLKYDFFHTGSIQKNSSLDFNNESIVVAEIEVTTATSFNNTLVDATPDYGTEEMSDDSLKRGLLFLLLTLFFPILIVILIKIEKWKTSRTPNKGKNVKREKDNWYHNNIIIQSSNNKKAPNISHFGVFSPHPPDPGLV